MIPRYGNHMSLTHNRHGIKSSKRNKESLGRTKSILTMEIKEKMTSLCELHFACLLTRLLHACVYMYNQILKCFLVNTKRYNSEVLGMFVGVPKLE